MRSQQRSSDPRDIRVGNRPLFLVYRARLLRDAARTPDPCRHEADRLGIGELYLCKVEGFAADRERPPVADGFDATVDWIPDRRTLGRPLSPELAGRLFRRVGLGVQAFRHHHVFRYSDVMSAQMGRDDPRLSSTSLRDALWDNLRARTRRLDEARS